MNKVIVKVKYTDVSQRGVALTFSDNSRGEIPLLEGRYKYTDLLNEWLKVEDNKIEAFKTQAELDKEAEDKATQDAKDTKTKELNELYIDHNGVVYDAHQEAIGNMGTVVSIANATFNKAISVGIVAVVGEPSVVMSLADAYSYVYKDQTITWKGHDNKPHTVQIESLVEASKKAMTEKSKILFKY